MPSTVDTSTTQDATGGGGNRVAVAPSDATALVIYNNGASSIRANLASPYTGSWIHANYGDTTGRNGDALWVRADDSIDTKVNSDSNGAFWFYYTRSGVNWVSGSFAAVSNYVANSDTIATSSWIGRDVQSRLWLLSLDDVNATYQFGLEYSTSPYSSWTAATPDGTNLGEQTRCGVAAALIGNFLVIIYDSGSGGLKYLRVDVHNASLGSWSSAVAVPGISDVTTSSVLALGAIPGGSTGLLAYNGSNGISALVYNAATDTWGTPTVLSSAANDRHPSVVPAGTGAIYVLWAQYAAANSYAIAAQIYAAGQWSSNSTAVEPSGNNIRWPCGAFISGTSQLALMWTQGTASPWNVQFDAVTAPPLAIFGQLTLAGNGVLTANPSPIPGTVTLSDGPVPAGAGSTALVHTYDTGDLVRIAAAFAVGSLAADPSTITCLVRDPAFNVTTPTVLRDATGAYHASIDLTNAVPGVWYFRFQGTGACQAAEESRFFVEPSNT